MAAEGAFNEDGDAAECCPDEECGGAKGGGAEVSVTAEGHPAEESIANEGRCVEASGAAERRPDEVRVAAKGHPAEVRIAAEGDPAKVGIAAEGCPSEVGTEEDGSFLLAKRIKERLETLGADGRVARVQWLTGTQPRDQRQELLRRKMLKAMLALKLYARTV
jgi:hypothetical protein